MHVKWYLLRGLGLHLLFSLLIVHTHWLSLCLFRAFVCFWILLFASWLLYGVFYNLDTASYQTYDLHVFFSITYVISF